MKCCCCIGIACQSSRIVQRICKELTCILPDSCKRQLWLADKREGQKASDKFYWDAKWSSARGSDMLFAASAAQTLDVYTANYHDDNEGQ